MDVILKLLQSLHVLVVGILFSCQAGEMKITLNTSVGHQMFNHFNKLCRVAIIFINRKVLTFNVQE